MNAVTNRKGAPEALSHTPAPAGAGGDENAVVPIFAATLGTLMPLHMVVSPTGHIRAAGPTMVKLFPPDKLLGARLLDLFEFRRPKDIRSMADLRAVAKGILKVRLRQPPRTTLKGQVVVLPDNGGVLLNFSLGIGVVDAVARHGLTAVDFPATDLAVEMMYLVEAKQALMEESGKLNLRLRAARSEAEEQAMTDTLTGLKNRRAMELILTRYTIGGVKFGLMQIDLDHFKAVNDNLGHAAGDHVLQQAARILKNETRKDDTVIRAGGDEFVIIFHCLSDPITLGGIADRLLERLQVPIPYQGHACRISASIGITVSDRYKVPDPDQMLLDADQALYASKAGGRSCYRISDAVLD